MALTYDDWLTELEDAIKTHIATYLMNDTVDILIEQEFERPLPNPTITIHYIGGDSRPTGGMNHVGDGEQGQWEMPEFFITVNTDTTMQSPRALRNRIASELQKKVFEQYVHIFKGKTEASVVTMRSIGVTSMGGPTKDNTIFQQQFMLQIEVIIPFTSLVL